MYVPIYMRTSPLYSIGALASKMCATVGGDEVIKAHDVCVYNELMLSGFAP